MCGVWGLAMSQPWEGLVRTNQHNQTPMYNLTGNNS